MVTALAARWLLTAVFAACRAGGGTAVARDGRAGAAGGPGAGCLLRREVRGSDRHDLAVRARRRNMAANCLFGCASLWFGLAGSRRTGPGLPTLLHALMAGAMIWMLTVLPAVTGTPPPGHGRAPMTAMSPAAAPVPVLAVSILLAVFCAAASIPWLVRAIGPGPRVKDPLAASQAAMSAGMVAMLLTTL